MKPTDPEECGKHLCDLVGGPLDGQRYETDDPVHFVEYGGDLSAYAFAGEEVCGRRQLVWKQNEKEAA